MDEQSYWMPHHPVQPEAERVRLRWLPVRYNRHPGASRDPLNSLHAMSASGME